MRAPGSSTRHARDENGEQPVNDAIEQPINDAIRYIKARVTRMG